jgi:FMN-dependent NADH-azoreductase
MKKVLVINSSAKALNSNSRKLTEIFVEYWKSIHTIPNITFRELGNADVPHINESWITAAFKPATARTEAEIAALKISDTYIAELKEADIIVLGAPMYNWSIPSALKAYIDQVLRVNETFKFSSINTEHPYIGLLENKTVFLLLSRGNLGYEEGQYNEHMNFQSGYLKTVFNIMGLSNIHVVSVDGSSLDREKFKETVTNAHQTARDLLERELI